MMRTFYLLLACSSCLVVWGQPATVPVTMHAEDQLVQGPCYIFATVAAIESRAQAACLDLDLNEWSLYNSCVLGGGQGARPSSGTIMVNQVVDWAENEGIVEEGNNSVPTGVDQVPNPNDPTVRGIADFDCPEFCDEKKLAYQKTDETGHAPACFDDEGVQFAVSALEGSKYKLVPASNGKSVETVSFSSQSSASQKINTVKQLINQGYGVIGFFDFWGKDSDANGNVVDINHCVFIRGYQGSWWSYKDSWPDDNGIKTGWTGTKASNPNNLNFDSLTKIFYITGTVEPKQVSCNLSISGPSSITGSATYSLGGDYPNPCTISWSVSGGTFTGQGSSSITVTPSNCTVAQLTISATVQTPYATCSDSRTISNGSVLTMPSPIQVLSPQWDNLTGQTCPNTQLELQTGFDPNVSYQWSIAGASLLSGQGTYNVHVRTPSSSVSNLAFKVRTTNSCGSSPWQTLYGQSNSSTPGCGLGGGGGGFFAFSDDYLQIRDQALIWFGQRVAMAKREQQPIRGQIIDMQGRIVWQQYLGHSEERYSLQTLSQGTYVVVIQGNDFLIRDKFNLQR